MPEASLAPPHRPAFPRLLITAGPTQEPIDSVRYIGNRSSGRLGIALAEAAGARGWPVTLLLGPTPLLPGSTHIRLLRFRTTDDLARLLADELPGQDVLVMAAAVADYRPAQPASPTSKIKRGATGENLTLELMPTPDLLAACAAGRNGDRFPLIIGFALEPRERLIDSARSKLARKGIDFIVANPLETMDAAEIEASVLGADGSITSTPGPVSKAAFAETLCDLISLALPQHAPQRVTAGVRRA